MRTVDYGALYRYQIYGSAVVTTSAIPNRSKVRYFRADCDGHGKTIGGDAWENAGYMAKLTNLA